MPAEYFDEVWSLTNGAQFLRGDLHIHSFGGSHDVQDNSATPVAIVQTAVSNGLSVIAIADHNQITSVEQAINESANHNILVVPAVELSTLQGHLLCYLPDFTTLSTFVAQLIIHDKGTSTSRVENSMVDCLHRLQAFGGFGVLAHVDGPKGLEREVPGAPPHKADIIRHPALLGIELKNATSDIAYSINDPDPVRQGLGKIRSDAEDGSLPQLARVLNSDSHSLAKLGHNAAGDRRITRYKLETLSFEALHYAMRNSDARVRLEDEIPRSVPTVSAIKFSGGFLRDQSIHFSPNLTCIIGGRGTGKSTMFEGVRAFSSIPSQSSVIDSDVWPERIDLMFVDEADDSHHLSRSKGDEICTNNDDPLEGPVSIPVECYGQGETQKISEQAQSDPGALLRYLDRFTNVSELISAEEKFRSQIIALDAEIAKSRSMVEQIPQCERDLGVTRQQIKKFTDGNAKELIKSYQQIETERQARRTVVAQAKEVVNSLDYAAAKTSIGLLKSAADETNLVLGRDEFAAIKASADAFESSLSSSEADIQSRSAALNQLVEAKVEAWGQKEVNLLSVIDTQRQALEAQGITVDTAYLAQITQNEASLAERLKNLKAWEPHLATQLQKHEELRGLRWSARSQIYEQRRLFAAKATGNLRDALSDLNVSLKFEESAHSPVVQDLLVEVMGWRTNQVPRAEMIVRNLTVPKFIDAVRSNVPNAIANLQTKDGVSIFNSSDAATMVERFREPSNLARLEAAPVYDRPYLTVTRETQDQSGAREFKVREFAQLSLGQQQSVLLALMLSSDNPNPLLIDQPEDNLDGQFIYAQLVPVIRLAKEKRQIIIVTHNPNIAVLGDAEQIVVLGANNERSTVVSRGSIDNGPTRDSCCNILEGARSAFTKRKHIYRL
ncbi:TrlF family AAA-like ATPase [Aurantiacibacter gilvus]|uniref:TrlF family AAA-like ATPase n=1 Tax=Aurantiacibacter gilvus TaxID=3139141 RepID=A0ABU9IE68_9SPHN